MPSKPIRALSGVNVPGFPMAGFQVTLYGRIWATPEEPPRSRQFLAWVQVLLLNEFQVQGDAHTVDDDDALIKELLVSDFQVHELFECASWANEFNRLGSTLRARRKFVQDGKVKKLEFDVRRNPIR